MLAALGGALGAVLASWGKELLLRWGPWSIESEQVVAEIDWRVLGFAVAVSLVTGVLFGVAPALRAVRSGNEAALMKTQRCVEHESQLAIGQDAADRAGGDVDRAARRRGVVRADVCGT